MGMETFVHEQNLAYYRKLLSEKMHEQYRSQILKMLAEEVAKDDRPMEA